MAIDIGELRGILTLKDQFSGPVNKAAQELGFFSQSFGAITGAAGLAVTAVAAATGAVVALATHGTKIQSMQSSFDSLTGAIGESSRAMLGELRTATTGLVSDFDLMAASNKAMLLGLPVTTESMATMAQAATVLGRAMGQDAKKSLDDLTTALGRGSPLILDNLGLTVKVGEANEAYAKSLGKASSDLSEAEKKMAFYNAAMTAARSKVAELGGVHVTLGDQIQQARVGVGNFIDGLSAAVTTSPALVAGFEAVRKSLTAAFGGDQQKLIDTIVGYVNNFAIGLTYVGQVGIVAANGLVVAYYGVKTAISAVMTNIVDVTASVVGMAAKFYEFSANIPGVGSKVAGFAEDTRKASEFLDSMRDGLALQTLEAGKAAVVHNDTSAALGKLSDALVAGRAAIRATSSATADMVAQVKQIPPAAEEAASRSDESWRKVADSFRRAQQDIALEGTMGLERRMLELQFAQEAELAAVKALKDLTIAEQEDLSMMVIEKYQLRTEAARLSGDAILQKTQEIQAEIALAQATGLDAQIMAIEQARQKEIEGLAEMRLRYGEEYEAIVALVNTKYQQQTEAARGHFADVRQAAEEAGFKTREELERTANTAVETYERMRSSGLYTESQLREARETAESAKRESRGETAKFEMTSDQAWLAGTEQVLGALGQKHKSAAIAGSILATYQSVAKALASAPWPANLALAAGAAAVGWANVSKIRSSQPGYRTGTPNLDYKDFGRGSLETLHGREVVIPKRRAGEFAADVAAGLAGQIGSGSDAPLEAHVHLHLDGREITRSVVRFMPRELALAGVRL